MTKQKTRAPKTKKSAVPAEPTAFEEIEKQVRTHPEDGKRATDNAIKEPEKVKAFDAFQNLLARLGFGSNNLLESTRYPLTRLSNNYVLMQSLYRSNWIAQRVADTYPEEMCKLAPKLTCQVHPKEIASFDRVVEKCGVWRKLEWALKLANIFGGSGAIIIIKGHENHLDRPLDFEEIRPDSFRGVIPFDRWSGITPSAKVSTDIEKPLDYGLPESYRVTKESGGGFDIHASRVLRFTGRDLPLWEQQAMMYWGESLFEAVYEELVKRDNTSFNIVSLMFRAQILGLKIPELGSILSGLNLDTNALQRLTAVISTQSQLMSNQGLAVFGKDGGIEQHTYSFGGLADMYHEFMKDTAAASEIPFEILFGRDSGLGDSGEGSLQIYYDRVAHKQTTKLSPALEKLYPCVAMSTWGDIPKDFAWSFPIARTVSNKEKAELAKQLNTPVIEAFNAGLISQKTSLMEFRQNSDITGVFSNITDDDIENADDQVHGPGEMGGMGEMGGEGAFGSPKAKNPKAKEPRPSSTSSEAEDSLEPLDCDGCGELIRGNNYEERKGKFLCPKCIKKAGKDGKRKAADAVMPGYDPYSAPLGSVEGMKQYHGLDVVIETPKGQRRVGLWWRHTLPADYGYIESTTGADGDEMDCYVGPDVESPLAFVIDQNKLDSDRFDEHKVMLGYNSMDEAKQAFLQGHNYGKQIFRGITPMTMIDFKRWLAKGDRKKPLYTPDKFNTVEFRAQLPAFDAEICASCEAGDCTLHAE